jgi:copper(I)-binding protein
VVTRARALGAAFLCALALGSVGQAADAVVAAGAWARATPPGLTTGAAYVTLKGGSVADTLEAARLDGVDRIEFHESRTEDGIARMRPLDMVPVPPHATVEFAPASLHLMLIGLERPLVAGERRTLVLVFERAGEVRVELDVRPATTAVAPEHHAVAPEHH